MGMHYKKHPSK